VRRAGWALASVGASRMPRVLLLTIHRDSARAACKTCRAAAPGPRSCSTGCGSCQKRMSWRTCATYTPTPRPSAMCGPPTLFNTAPASCANGEHVCRPNTEHSCRPTTSGKVFAACAVGRRPCSIRKRRGPAEGMLLLTQTLRRGAVWLAPAAAQGAGDDRGDAQPRHPAQRAHLLRADECLHQGAAPARAGARV